MANTYTINNLTQPYTINTGAGVGGVSGTVTITNGGAGYTTTNGSSWLNASTTAMHNGSGKPVLTVPYGEETVILEKQATLDVKGQVRINGQDLEERLKTIERVLGIPERDVTMEAKYPSLKKKFDEYINALEKYRTFERIKGEE